MPTAETDEGATGLSDAHQKLGNFISEVMHVRASLRLVIDEGPEGKRECCCRQGRQQGSF